MLYIYMIHIYIYIHVRSIDTNFLSIAINPFFFATVFGLRGLFGLSVSVRRFLESENRVLKISDQGVTPRDIEAMFSGVESWLRKFPGGETSPIGSMGLV